MALRRYYKTTPVAFVSHSGNVMIKRAFYNN